MDVNVKEKKGQVNQSEEKVDFQKRWDEYEFDTTQPLFTKDVYAYFGKGGNAEFISQKMSELAGKEIVIPKFIKNDKLWNEIVKPFRELPQEAQTNLKNELMASLEAISQEKKQNPPKEQTDKEKMQNMDDFYRNQYEINPEKKLNKHDILAFYFQYGKGAQNKLEELTSSFLGIPVTIEVRNGQEFEEKIINPILQKGFFSGIEFKNILIDNIAQQKAIREEQALTKDSNIVVFDQSKKELFTVDKEENKVLIKGVSVVSKNDKVQEMTLEEWGSFKKENINNWIIGKREDYKIGDELALGFTGEKELFKITKIETNENPLLNKLHFEAQKGLSEDTSVRKEVINQFDIDLFIGQNKAVLVTPQMKEKGFSLNKDHESFHLEHLKRIDVNKGITDKNLYAIINLKLSDDLDKTRREVLEKYTGVPFDELKKFKKGEMIEEVYKIKRGADKGKEFELKSDIQKLFLASEAERNFIAPEAYEKYLEGLTYPADKELWELQHIDMFLLQSKNLPELFEGTPLENDSKAKDILKMFDLEDKDNILYSRNFHLGEKELSSKQYLMNAINYCENKEQMAELLINNLQDEISLQNRLKR